MFSTWREGAHSASQDKAPRVSVSRQSAWELQSPQAEGGRATYDEDGNTDEEAKEQGTQQVLSVLQLLKIDWWTVEATAEATVEATGAHPQRHFAVRQREGGGRLCDTRCTRRAGTHSHPAATSAG